MHHRHREEGRARSCKRMGNSSVIPTSHVIRKFTGAGDDDRPHKLAVFVQWAAQLMQHVLACQTVGVPASDEQPN